MDKPLKAAASGLDSVIAAETALSHVDGEAGRLIVAGHDIGALAASHDYEGALALLWQAAGRAPETARNIRAALGRARLDAFGHVPALLAASEGLTVVEGLRAGLAMLPDDHALAPELRLVAAHPVFVAALCRRAEGKAPAAPDPARGQAADFLAMLTGETPKPEKVRALDAYLVTVIDHGMNASTFAARIIASTRAGMVSAIVGGLCALKGPLHGGAPGPVLDMLDEIGVEEAISPWLDAHLAEGDRLMGFGHRIYKVRDPRADVLNGAVARLAASGAEGPGTEGSGAGRIALARAVERKALEALHAAKPGRRLDTNVEFFTALLLEALAIPRAAFTAVFGIARVGGWTAHVIEQERVGRLIRPQSAYIGPWPEK